MTNITLQKENTLLKARLLSLYLSAIGLSLYFVSPLLPGIAHDILGPFGSLLFVTGMFTILWELSLKRSFTRELLDLMQISRSLEASGICYFTDDCFQDIPWKELIKKANKIDIAFLYGSTWRGTLATELNEAARDHQKSIRIILPDWKDDKLMEIISNRMDGVTSNDLKTNVETASKELEKIFKDGKASCQILKSSFDLGFAMYIFDDISIHHIYSPLGIKGRFPNIVAREGGTIFAFLEQAFNQTALNTKLIYSVNSK